MKEYLSILPIAFSLVLTAFVLPYWIRKAKQIGLVWKDMNKSGDTRVAGSGGIAVLFGFIGGSFLYIAYQVFYLGIEGNFLLEIFAMITVVLLVSMLGFIDDLLGWQRGGLSKRSRLLFVALSAIPLVVINAGISAVNLPFIGPVQLGLLYPIILIPIGVVGATVTFNFLAGFNGLEAGLSILLLSGVGSVAYFTGSFGLAVMAFCMVAPLVVFLLYNFYPAKVFPGDSMTYATGALFAIIAILGNFEKIAVFFFIPVLVEMFLKIRGKLVKQSFGKPLGDGTLGLNYNKIYSLNHLSIYLMQKAGIKPTERKVVLSLWALQLIIIVTGFIIFRQGIFL